MYINGLQRCRPFSFLARVDRLPVRKRFALGVDRRALANSPFDAKRANLVCSRSDAGLSIDAAPSLMNDARQRLNFEDTSNRAPQT